MYLSTKAWSSCGVHIAVYMAYCYCENIMSAYEDNSYEDVGYESAIPHEIPGWHSTPIEAVAGNNRSELILPLVDPIVPLDFATQFKERTLLDQKETNGVDVSVVDVHPEIAKTDVPLLLAPGFSEGPLTLEPNMQYFSGWGRRVVTYDAPNGIGLDMGSSDSQNADYGEQFTAYEMGKARTIDLVMKDRNITKTDGVGHSEGCINLVIAALKHPEKFRNLILVNPGGMVGNTKLEELVGRIYKHFISEKKTLRDNESMKAIRQSSAHERRRNLINHPRRSIEAAQAIACTEINGLLRELKGKGIGISIIHGVDDAIFPMDKISELAQTDQFDGFYSVRGGHNDFFLNPEPYSMLVDHALDAHEAKEKKLKGEASQDFNKMGR